MDAKQLRLLLPGNVQEFEAAKALTSLDPVELAPVIPQKLRHLPQCDSPVAEAFSPFVVNQGEGYVANVSPFLSQSTWPEVKQVILSGVLPACSREVYPAARMPRLCW
jgi:hypothetical protein